MSELFCGDCVHGDLLISKITQQTLHLPKNALQMLKNREMIIDNKSIKSSPQRVTSSHIIGVTRTCDGLPFWHKRKVEPDAKCVNKKAFVAATSKPPQSLS